MNLPPQKELLPAFQALDTDGDGVITREEMVAAIQRLSTTPSFARGGLVEDLEEAANQIFDALDVDKSGSLDYDEFVSMMSGTHSDYLADHQAAGPSVAC